MIFKNIGNIADKFVAILLYTSCTVAITASEIPAGARILFPQISAAVRPVPAAERVLPPIPPISSSSDSDRAIPGLVYLSADADRRLPAFGGAGAPSDVPPASTTPAAGNPAGGGGTAGPGDYFPHLSIAAAYPDSSVCQTPLPEVLPKEALVKKLDNIWAKSRLKAFKKTTVSDLTYSAFAFGLKEEYLHACIDITNSFYAKVSNKNAAETLLKIYQLISKIDSSKAYIMPHLLRLNFDGDLNEFYKKMLVIYSFTRNEKFDFRQFFSDRVFASKTNAYQINELLGALRHTFEGCVDFLNVYTDSSDVMAFKEIMCYLQKVYDNRQRPEVNYDGLVIRMHTIMFNLESVSLRYFYEYCKVHEVYNTENLNHYLGLFEQKLAEVYDKIRSESFDPIDRPAYTNFLLHKALYSLQDVSDRNFKLTLADLPETIRILDGMLSGPKYYGRYDQVFSIATDALETYHDLSPQRMTPVMESGILSILENLRSISSPGSLPEVCRFKETIESYGESWCISPEVRALLACISPDSETEYDS